MLIALPVRVIYLSVPDLEWCFHLRIFFFWQITCIVDVNRESDENNVKITNVKIFWITSCAYLKNLLFQTLDFKRFHRTSLHLPYPCLYSCPTELLFRKYLHNVRVYSCLHYASHNWFHYDFEMLICLSNKLNYLICFECFRLLHNTIF